jgi:hypothetical protein
VKWQCNSVCVCVLIKSTGGVLGLGPRRGQDIEQVVEEGVYVWKGLGDGVWRPVAA